MAESTPAGKRTPWLLIVLLILLLCGGVAAGVFFLVSSGKISFGNSSAAAVEEKPAPPAAPIFVTIAPFTVNLQGNPNEQRLLYIGLSLKVGDAASEALLPPRLDTLDPAAFRTRPFFIELLACEGGCVAGPKTAARNAPATAPEILDFAESAPDWPGQDALARNMEALLETSPDDALQIAYTVYRQHIRHVRVDEAWVRASHAA